MGVKNGILLGQQLFLVPISPFVFLKIGYEVQKTEYEIYAFSGIFLDIVFSAPRRLG